MSNTVVINSANYVAGSGNKFIYNFPQQMEFRQGAKVALQKMTIYNAVFNITAAYGNNTFTINWYADTLTTVNVTIPDGYYSGSDLNYFLQSIYVANNMYATTDNGSNYVYFGEILTNSVRYAFQINSYSLVTAAEAATLGYTKASGASWNWPSSATSPQLVISSGLGTLLGFAETLSFPSAGNLTSSYEFLSDQTPVISPVNSYLLTLNLLNSKYAIPNNIFYCVPITESFGDIIVSESASMIYNSISAGRYSSIIITILDQNYNNITLQDTEIVVQLSIIE